MVILERLPRETNQDYALRTIKSNIINFGLEPGARISENELATALGLSRTPVREALMLLEKVKIVEVVPQKRGVVSYIDLNMLEESQFTRQVLESAVTEILQLAISSFISEDIEKAYLVEPLEERIDVLCDEVKLHHIERVQNEVCTLNHGFVFNDMLTNFERVSDHCSNIAIATIELQSNEMDAHGYLSNLKEQHAHNFDLMYAGYCEKFKI